MGNEDLLNLLMQLGPAGTPGAAAAGPQDPLLPAQNDWWMAQQNATAAREALTGQERPENVEPDPMKKWQTVVQALLSGASTYAAGLNPGVQARDFVGEMEAQRQQAADRLNQQNQEEFGRERQNLLLTLQDAIRGEDRARQDVQRQEDMRFRSGERQMDRAIHQEDQLTGGFRELAMTAGMVGVDLDDFPRNAEGLQAASEAIGAARAEQAERDRANTVDPRAREYSLSILQSAQDVLTGAPGEPDIETKLQAIDPKARPKAIQTERMRLQFMLRNPELTAPVRMEIERIYKQFERLVEQYEFVPTKRGGKGFVDKITGGGGKKNPKYENNVPLDKRSREFFKGLFGGGNNQSTVADESNEAMRRRLFPEDYR